MLNKLKCSVIPSLKLIGFFNLILCYLFLCFGIIAFEHFLIKYNIIIGDIK